MWSHRRSWCTSDTLSICNIETSYHKAQYADFPNRTHSMSFLVVKFCSQAMVGLLKSRGERRVCLRAACRLPFCGIYGTNPVEGVWMLETPSINDMRGKCFTRDVHKLSRPWSHCKKWQKDSFCAGGQFKAKFVIVLLICIDGMSRPSAVSMEIMDPSTFDPWRRWLTRVLFVIPSNIILGSLLFWLLCFPQTCTCTDTKQCFT